MGKVGWAPVGQHYNPEAREAWRTEPRRLEQTVETREGTKGKSFGPCFECKG